MKYEWMNPQIMSLHLLSDELELTLKLTEFTKIKIDRADDIFLARFPIDLTIFTVVF